MSKKSIMGLGIVLAAIVAVVAISRKPSRTALTPTPSVSRQVLTPPAPPQESAVSPTLRPASSPAAARATISPLPTASPARLLSPAVSPAASPRAVMLDVSARQWTFEPSTLRVPLGGEVTLRVRSVDVTHGITIPELGVSQQLEAGKTTTIRFTASRSGTFSFFCSVFCGSGHREMTGKIVVE